MAQEFLARTSKKMTEPKKYKLNNDVTPSMLIKAGFDQSGDGFVIDRVLYMYDNGGRLPYITLRLYYSNGKLTQTLICESGETYIPFYNPELRHNNRVYETVVNKYNRIMDYFVRLKILDEVT